VFGGEFLGLLRRIGTDGCLYAGWTSLHRAQWRPRVYVQRGHLPAGFL
jgi:hypothetical protein